MTSEAKRVKRGDPYDPDLVDMREELGQLRIRAKRAGRSMAEQSEWEDKTVEASKSAPRPHGYSIARFLGYDQWGRPLYDSADPIEDDRRG